MWDLFANSLRLFFKGKLFREPRAMFRQWLIGFAAALVAVVLLAKLGVPLWGSVAAAALVAGVLQPYLFKNLKYA
jgi:membrane associated rhomboid family serine protease